MKFKTIHLLSVLLIMALILPVQAKDFSESQIRKDLPKMLGANNVGREFYFNFVPCWQTSLPGNDLMIYVSSGVRTKVVCEVPGKGFIKVQYSIPNDIINFKLSPAIGQPYAKSPWEAPLADKVWPAGGVHVYADDPIIVYGVTRYTYTSDGFLAVPVPALGKEYIIASWEDVSSNNGQWLPSSACITAAYDKTKVTFTMGGNPWSATAGGQTPGQQTKWNLNASDVLLISSLGAKSDLSGSIVQADKPVAVVDGNFCAYIPTNCGCCDVIESMELPTNTWGTEYHVTQIINRKKSSEIKVFAKEANTKIYRDYNQIGFIRDAGGVVDDGYLVMRGTGDDGPPRPVVISGDKPISVTQYNTGQSDDNVSSDPFQLILTPIEQYQKEIIFNTPGIRGGVGFKVNYINLCFQSTSFGTVPDDLEFGQVIGGAFSWQKLANISPSPGIAFAVKPGGKKYYSKTLLLPGDGVYKLRANTPFAAYAYGFANYDSYGFPTSVALGDLTKIDTIAPRPAWNLACDGNVNGGADGDSLVIDYPDDDANRSNLSTIYMHSDVSYNYILHLSDFMPCEDRLASWGLEIIDNSQDAFAMVTFTDCAGNDSTVQITYSAVKLRVSPKTYDFGRFSVGGKGQKMFWVVNYSESSVAEIDTVKLKLLAKGLPQGFTLWNAAGTQPLQLASPHQYIPPLDSFPFLVKFDATKEGDFWDSVGIGDTCNFWNKAYVKAQVGQPVINVTNYDFPPTTVGTSSYGSFNVSNTGSTSLLITGTRGGYQIGDLGNGAYTIYKSQDVIDRNISVNNPITIKPNNSEQLQFQVSFMPSDTICYPDSIVFISNTAQTPDADSVCSLTGCGLMSNLTATSYNWDRKRIDRTDSIPSFPAGPYPSVVNALNPDIAIRLNNDGNDAITINNIQYSGVQGNQSSFIFDKAKLIGAVIPAHGELIDSVWFKPTTPGIHSVTIEYVTNNDSVNAHHIQTTLQGVGILPKIETQAIDFGQTIVKDTIHPVTKIVTIRNLTNAEWQFGDSLTITSLNPQTINTSIGSWAIAEPFRFDLSALTFPIILQPGDTLQFPAQFDAMDGNPATAKLSTASDAETDVTTNWKGDGLVPNSTITDASINTCVGITNVLNVTVTNNGETNMHYDKIAVTSADQTLFSFNPAADNQPFDLKPTETKVLHIQYVPDQQKTSIANVTCDAHPYTTDPKDPASWDIPLTSTLTCNASHYDRAIEIFPKDTPPDKPVAIDNFFERSINLLPSGIDMQYAKVTEIDVKIQFNSDFLKLSHWNLEPYKSLDGDGDGIMLGDLFNNAPYAGQFTYSVDDQQRTGNITIKIQSKSGSGIYINSPNGGELLKLTFGAYLPQQNNTSSPITASAVAIQEEGACVDIASAAGTIKIDSTCVFDIRRITYTNQSFYLGAVKPNPVTGNQATIEFEVATHSCPTKIEIYNSANQLVATPVDKVMEPGRYQVDVPVQTWASGAYYYIMKAGEFTNQQRMLIVK